MATTQFRIERNKEGRWALRRSGVTLKTFGVKEKNLALQEVAKAAGVARPAEVRVFKDDGKLQYTYKYPEKKVKTKKTKAVKKTAKPKSKPAKKVSASAKVKTPPATAVPSAA